MVSYNNDQLYINDNWIKFKILNCTINELKYFIKILKMKFVKVEKNNSILHRCVNVLTGYVMLCMG